MRWVAIAGLVVAIGWATLALAIDGPGWLAAVPYLAVSIALLVWRRWTTTTRLACVALFAAVLVWWLAIAPSNDRPWLEDVARVATARIDGNRIVFRNVRNFAWQSETTYVPAWEERAYDLDTLVGVDVGICDWGAAGIIHTIVSWEFAGGQFICVSIETRKEKGEGYSAVRGLFRQFELIYVVGDERDIIGVRVAHRNERVRLYRLQVQPEEARDLLLSYVRELNHLASEPRWYNALTASCTVSIRMNALAGGAQTPWDWRFLVNSHVDEVMLERGRIHSALPLDQLRAACDVTDRARAALDQPDFSTRIRAGVPGYGPGAPR